jgi:transcriptional regulator GlxA family with amidase domain
MFKLSQPEIFCPVSSKQLTTHNSQLTTHNSQHNPKDWRIRKILTLLTDQLDYQWQVPELAEKVKLSARQLQRLFKIEMKCSLWQYLRQLRLTKAGELLRTTDDNVTQIAALVGMHDYSHFVRDFQQTYRETPCEYRKQHRVSR